MSKWAQKLKRRIFATFGFNRTAQRATQPKLHSMFSILFLKIALSAAELMSFGHVKDKCYTDKPGTVDALKDNIREAIGEIQLHSIDNVLKNWTDRVGYCMASPCSHLNEIIFHYKPVGLYFQIKKEGWESIQEFFFKHFPKKSIWRTLHIEREYNWSSDWNTKPSTRDLKINKIKAIVKTTTMLTTLTNKYLFFFYFEEQYSGDDSYLCTALWWNKKGRLLIGELRE